jgi:hypothetical protein
VSVVFLTDSVRRNRLLKHVTRAEVEMTVKLWLRYAVDRSGGRANREQRRKKVNRAKDTDVESD